MAVRFQTGRESDGVTRRRCARTAATSLRHQNASRKTNKVQRRRQIAAKYQSTSRFNLLPRGGGSAPLFREKMTTVSSTQTSQSTTFGCIPTHFKRPSYLREKL